MRTRAFLLMFATATLLGTSGCGDNPVDDPDGSHFTTAGLALDMSGSHLVIIDSSQVEGSITILADSLTQEIGLTFTDEGDGTFPEGDEFEVFVRSGDTSIVRIEEASLSTHSGKVAHGGPGGSFKIRGVSAGNAVIEIGVLHDGESDYAAPDVPVSVVN